MKKLSSAKKTMLLVCCMGMFSCNRAEAISNSAKKCIALCSFVGATIFMGWFGQSGKLGEGVKFDSWKGYVYHGFTDFSLGTIVGLTTYLALGGGLLGNDLEKQLCCGEISEEDRKAYEEKAEKLQGLLKVVLGDLESQDQSKIRSDEQFSNEIDVYLKSKELPVEAAVVACEFAYIQNMMFLKQYQMILRKVENGENVGHEVDKNELLKVISVTKTAVEKVAKRREILKKDVELKDDVLGEYRKFFGLKHVSESKDGETKKTKKEK
ncbi:hypothetical protein ACFLY6_02800 [Candidatus Dependentiae bacterium]